MALSPNAVNLIGTAIQTVGSYFSARDKSKAENEAEKARARLYDLQAKEQSLRNNAVAMSLSDRNDSLPFANSAPGKVTEKSPDPPLSQASFRDLALPAVALIIGIVLLSAFRR